MLHWSDTVATWQGLFAFGDVQKIPEAVHYHLRAYSELAYGSMSPCESSEPRMFEHHNCDDARCN